MHMGKVTPDRFVTVPQHRSQHEKAQKQHHPCRRFGYRRDKSVTATARACSIRNATRSEDAGRVTGA